MQPTYTPLLRHPLSRHANNRMQQRSIPQVVVDLLLDLGHATDAGGGAERYQFDADSWAEACFLSGLPASKLERYRNVYAIVAFCGLVVTTGYTH